MFICNILSFTCMHSLKIIHLLLLINIYFVSNLLLYLLYFHIKLSHKECDIKFLINNCFWKYYIFLFIVWSALFAVKYRTNHDFLGTFIIFDKILNNPILHNCSCFISNTSESPPWAQEMLTSKTSNEKVAWYELIRP